MLLVVHRDLESVFGSVDSEEIGRVDALWMVLDR